MDIKYYNLTMNDLIFLPMIIKAILIITVFFLIVFLGYLFHQRHQLNDLNQLKKKEKTLSTIISRESKPADTLHLDNQSSQTANQGLETLLQHLPNEFEIPDLLSKISTLGINNDLYFKLFKPEPEIKMEFYTELPIKIEVEGNYDQLVQFVNDITELKRIVTLQDFTLNLLNERYKTDKEFSDQLLLTMILKIYRFDGNLPKAPLSVIDNSGPILSPAQIIHPIENLRSPFLTDAKTLDDPNEQNNNALKKFSLTSYKMLGSLEQHHQIFALLQAPDGNVYSITEGQPIGNNGWQVIKITSSDLQAIKTIKKNGELTQFKKNLSIKKDT